MGSSLSVCCNCGVREVGEGGAGRAMAMAMQSQEPGRGGGHRKLRNLPDCDVYIRTGECVLGMTCLFNHPPERQRLQFNLQQKLDALGMDEHPENLESQMVDGLLPVNKVMEQEVLATRSNLPAFISAAGDIHSNDIGPSCRLDPSSSSSAKHYCAVAVVQRGDCSKLDSSSELESVIEDSRVHWSELSSNNDSDGTGESNREIFESLRRQPKYECWLQCDVAPGDISLRTKIAEGGQAEIFEVEVRSKRVGLAGVFGSVLKVFKKGFSLQDLKSQWPDGLLFGGQLAGLFQGGMVLEDDRFALLLLRCDMDLRKLIDVTLDRNFPIYDHFRWSRPKELRAYKPKCARSECSTPVFSEECAERIMYRIAQEMKYLHSVDILHRDLKASNILCSIRVMNWVSIFVADYESSIGVVGTAFWRAPEILKQMKERKSGIEFTREADVYGFAMTCYEIWTGHIPFEEYSPHDYDHVLNGARPSLPAHVPSWVKALIQRCWHQNPAERPSFSAIVEEWESKRLFPWPLPGFVDPFTGHAPRRLVRVERAFEIQSQGDTEGARVVII